MTTVFFLMALTEFAPIGKQCRASHSAAEMPVSSWKECHSSCDIKPQCEGFSIFAGDGAVHCMHFSEVPGAHGECTPSSCCFARVWSRTPSQNETLSNHVMFLGLVPFTVFILHELSRQRARRAHTDPDPASPPETRVDLSKRADDLPLTVWSTESGADAECVLCITGYETGDRIRHLPCCAHVYHAECIDRWLTGAVGRTCPLCKADPFAAER